MSASPKSPVPTEAARDRLATLAEQAEHDKDRVVLTRAGKPVAAVVPIEDVLALEAIEDAEDAAAVQQARARWAAEGRAPGIPLEEIAHQLGIDLSVPDA